MEPGAPHLRALHSLPDSSGAGGGRVSLGEGTSQIEKGSQPLAAPGVLRVPLGGGGAVSPPPRFPWEARGGRRCLIPTPSLTLRARGGREGEAQSPKQQRAGAASGSPSPGRLGVAAARPSGPLSRGLAICSRVAPWDGEPETVRRRRLGRCDSDPRVPRDPPNTQTHTEAAGVIHTAARRGGAKSLNPKYGSRLSSLLSNLRRE